MKRRRWDGNEKGENNNPNTVGPALNRVGYIVPYQYPRHDNEGGEQRGPRRCEPGHIEHTDPDREQGVRGHQHRKQHDISDSSERGKITFIVEKAEVCGSIRREKPEVKDIDIVLIPRQGIDLQGYIKNRFNCLQMGKKIIRLKYKEADIDIYVATNENFETLKLIRTGSALHNKKLCSIAKSRNWRLHADGQGLETDKGWFVGEEPILTALLGKYVEPRDRD